MFRFFTQKNWFVWSWFGSAIILSSLWIQVKIDVKINEFDRLFLNEKPEESHDLLKSINSDSKKLIEGK